MLYCAKIAVFEVDKYKLSSSIIVLFYMPDERTIPSFAIIFTRIMNGILHNKIKLYNNNNNIAST